jgi:hypothetical protein
MQALELLFPVVPIPHHVPPAIHRTGLALSQLTRLVLDGLAATFVISVLVTPYSCSRPPTGLEPVSRRHVRSQQLETSQPPTIAKALGLPPSSDAGNFFTSTSARQHCIDKHQKYRLPAAGTQATERLSQRHTPLSWAGSSNVSQAGKITSPGRCALHKLTARQGN